MPARRSCRLEGTLKKTITHDHQKDGIDRRGFLQCMAWAGTGVVWTIGAGMEFALTDRWSAKAEYMHYEFPEYNFVVASPNTTARASTAGDTVRIGVNYHFRP